MISKIKTIIFDKLTNKNLLIFLALTSIFALSGAYISQYFFNMQPCNLCLWQRKPFIVALILVALFLTAPFLFKYQNFAVKFIIFLLLVNSVIAFYHTGVEQKWFLMPESCSSSIDNSINLEDLKTALQSASYVKCDKPQFMFLGLSMASWNMIYCLFMALLTMFLLKKMSKVKP